MAALSHHRSAAMLVGQMSARWHHKVPEHPLMLSPSPGLAAACGTLTAGPTAGGPSGRTGGGDARSLNHVGSGWRKQILFNGGRNSPVKRRALTRGGCRGQNIVALVPRVSYLEM